MVNKTDLANLRDYDENNGRVLSIYLDVDQSNVSNLNRGFELALSDQLRLLTSFEEESERRDFEASAALVSAFVSRYLPVERGLVLFAKSTGSLWVRELNVPTKTDVRWGRHAHIQPLIEALDEYQRYGVVLIDRSKAKIYTVLLGKVEKYAEVLSGNFVRHTKTAGRDHLYSQPGFQRKADEHVHLHMKRVVETLEDLVAALPFDRLILAGTAESTSEMCKQLPKWLKTRVVGTAPLSMSATESEVLAITETIEQKAERHFEFARIERLLDASGTRATADVSETLKAVNEKRVRELMYAEGGPIPGTRCRQCGAVFTVNDSLCAYCNVAVDPVENVVEAAADRALAAGASVEQIRGEAAGRLNAAGGLGAFLRY